MSALVSVLAALGTAGGIGMALSPLPTMKTIVSTKSIGEYSVFPYVVTFCQCGLWMTYATLTPGKGALIPVNVFIFCIELAYVGIFLKYATPDVRHKLWGTIGYVCGLTAGAIILALITPATSAFVGFFAVISNIIMYAAPLGVVKTVIETRSVQYMPFLLSLAGTISSFIWTCWALAARDPFVLLPNVLGFVLGVIQLVVYFKFKNADSAAASYYSPNAIVAEPVLSPTTAESESKILIK